LLSVKGCSSTFQKTDNQMHEFKHATIIRNTRVILFLVILRDERRKSIWNYLQKPTSLYFTIVLKSVVSSL